LLLAGVAHVNGDARHADSGCGSGWPSAAAMARMRRCTRGG
jgi:hypothetical protein